MTKKADADCFIICLFFGTPVEHLNLNKNDVKSRLAGAGFPVMNTGQAARRPTDSKSVSGQKQQVRIGKKK